MSIGACRPTPGYVSRALMFDTESVKGKEDRGLSSDDNRDDEGKGSCNTFELRKSLVTTP